MKRILTYLVLALLVVVLLPTGCGGAKIKVGSKTGPEGALLAEMIVLMLRANGFEVTDMSQLGSTDDLRKALATGVIDIYPEYTGNGALFFPGEDKAVWTRWDEGYERVKKLDEENFVWLEPAMANNRWAIVIPTSLAETANINTMSQFAEYVNNGNYVKLICSTEFRTNPGALPAFEDIYGFKLKPDQLKIVPGGNNAFMEREAAEGNDDVNASMAYSTDGYLSILELIILEDDGNAIKGGVKAQPVFRPAPIVRRDIYDKHGEKLESLLNPLFASLDDNTLRALNYEIGFSGKEVATTVAHRYITQNCLFDPKYHELDTIQNAMIKMMEDKRLSSVTPTSATSDMSAFPAGSPLFPEYLRTRTATGTYSCDRNGLVTQETTGW